MRIAVLGATGPTGQKVVLQALERGWFVSALVRNSQALDEIKNDNLKILLCDIYDEDSVCECLADCEALVSCLGSRQGLRLWAPCSLYSESMKHITAGMRKSGTNRLVVITASCTKYKPENPKFIEWFLKPVILGRLLADMAIMEDHLLSDKCNDINYTIVKPNGLTNESLMDVEVNTHESEFCPGGSMSIPRANVAKFMLDAIETDQWNRKAIAIAV